MPEEIKITVFMRDGGKQSYTIDGAELLKDSYLIDKVETRPIELNKQRYFNLRNLAWETLLASGVTVLPIDLNKIIKYLGYNILSYQKDKIILDIIDQNNIREKYQAFSLDLNGRGVICFDEIENKQRMRFSIAHEIGHLILRHFAISADKYESEANMFARRLLVPMGLLHALKIKSPGEIEKLFDVSAPVAKYSFERYEMLLARKKFDTSELERKLANQFKDYTENYIKNKG